MLRINEEKKHTKILYRNATYISVKFKSAKIRLATIVLKPMATKT